jgi:hypothetical protein
MRRDRDHRRAARSDRRLGALDRGPRATEQCSSRSTETSISTDYGLSAAIHTKDIAKGIELAKRIETGICHINGPTVADEPQMPFGGVKASGYERFGGRAGVDAFTELRWITIQLSPRKYPF